jgi:hypothetical protein
MLYEALSGASPNQVIGYAEHYKIIDAEYAFCVEGLSCGNLFATHAHSSALEGARVLNLIARFIAAIAGTYAACAGRFSPW